MVEQLPDDLQQVVTLLSDRLEISTDEAIEFAVREWAIKEGFLEDGEADDAGPVSH